MARRIAASQRESAEGHAWILGMEPPLLFCSERTRVGVQSVGCRPGAGRGDPAAWKDFFSAKFGEMNDKLERRIQTLLAER